MVLPCCAFANPNVGIYDLGKTEIKTLFFQADKPAVLGP